MTEYSRDSTFNMGIAHLTRIDAILYDVANCSAEEDYEGWHKGLNILSREVFFLFNDKEMGEHSKLDNECSKSINSFLENKTFENKTKMYNAIINYEFFIKNQLARRGMLMAFKRDLKYSISDLE